MSEVNSENPIVTPQSVDDLKPKTKVRGVVTRLELYGAFIDIGLDANALIHISQLGNEHVNRVSDVLNVGDEVEVWVHKVDPERKQIMVTMIEPMAVEWGDLETGQVHTGTISRLESFGAFVNIGAEREGLVHISELSHDYVKHPSEVVKAGDEVQVKVLSFSKRKRRIDLSMKALQEKPETENVARREEIASFDFEDDVNEEMPTAMEIALRQAMGDDFPTKKDGRKKSKKKRRNREKTRSQQEEILNRTLHG